MGYDDDAAAIAVCELLQDHPHIGTCDAVEIAGRLVRQDQERVVGERSRYRDPLALPTGELPRQLCCLVSEPEAVEQRLGTLLDLGRR